VNDQNTQARLFGQSVLARMRGEEPPEGGYQGAYINNLAAEARAALGGDRDETAVRRFAIDRTVEQLAASVERLGVVYDEWYYESRLWAEGLPQQAIERLRESGHLVEKEGATWFRGDVAEGEELPEDEDRVV